MSAKALRLTPDGSAVHHDELPGRFDVNEGGSRPTVLLVEDDAAVRRVLRHMLLDQADEILEAGSAPEAIEVAAAYPGPIDLLLTDVVMPHTNCDVLVARLRADRPDMRVILISGYSAEVLSQYGVADSRPNFMPKPFTAEQLTAKIGEMLGIGKCRRGGLGA
jgi:two-component system cell cycle sensor histidine kinase/response regulator CckA